MHWNGMVCASPNDCLATQMSWNRCANAPNVWSHYGFDWSQHGFHFGYDCRCGENHCGSGWSQLGYRYGYGCRYDAIHCGFDWSQRGYHYGYDCHCDVIHCGFGSLPLGCHCGSDCDCDSACGFLSQIFCVSANESDSNPNDGTLDSAIGTENGNGILIPNGIAGQLRWSFQPRFCWLLFRWLLSRSGSPLASLLPVR